MKTAVLQSAARSFMALTAADLMSRSVTALSPSMSLVEAARMLSRSGISGAPVVDADGRCIGVLSSSDFVTRAGQEQDAVSFIAPWGEIINIGENADDEIRHYMTAQPIMVPPSAPIGELAQTMVDSHIHRVLVVVEQERPCGVVTSTDILAAVARTARKPPARKAKRDSPSTPEAASR